MRGARLGDSAHVVWGYVQSGSSKRALSEVKVDSSSIAKNLEAIVRSDRGYERGALVLISPYKTTGRISTSTNNDPTPD
jgi:hypothetical protein